MNFAAEFGHVNAKYPSLYLVYDRGTVDSTPPYNHQQHKALKPTQLKRRKRRKEQNEAVILESSRTTEQMDEVLVDTSLEIVSSEEVNNETDEHKSELLIAFVRKMAVQTSYTRIIIGTLPSATVAPYSWTKS